MITIRPEYQIKPKEAGTNQVDALVRSLAVFVLTPEIHAILEEEDPKALDQAIRALKDIGFRWPAPLPSSDCSDLVHVCRDVPSADLSTL